MEKMIEALAVLKELIAIDDESTLIDEIRYDADHQADAWQSDRLCALLEKARQIVAREEKEVAQ